MHIADLDLNILGANGIVGAGMGLATGAALAARLRGGDDAGIVFFGDGAANESIFHEAMNVAAIWRLPLVFFCENNQYGLSTAAADVTAGGSVAARAAGYGVPGEGVDGNDMDAVYEAVTAALARARAGEGPTPIEAHTWRWGDHSMRANLPRYRAVAEEARWQALDPLTRLAAALDEPPEALAALEPQADALAPAVLAPFQTATAEPPPGGRAITCAQAITEAMGQEMERDGRVFVAGEDVGAIGGIFGLTRGLQARFPGRVLDTLISEGAIGGLAVGAALAGQRPPRHGGRLDGDGRARPGRRRHAGARGDRGGGDRPPHAAPAGHGDDLRERPQDRPLRGRARSLPHRRPGRGDRGSHRGGRVRLAGRPRLGAPVAGAPA